MCSTLKCFVVKLMNNVPHACRASLPQPSRLRQTRATDWRALATPFYSAIVAILCDRSSTTVSTTAAPAQFFRAAINALRADATEEIVVFAPPAAAVAARRSLNAIPTVRIVIYDSGQNSSIDDAAHFATLAAEHLVVEHQSIAWELASRRAAPYHGVWAWCGIANCSTAASAVRLRSVRRKPRLSFIGVDARPRRVPSGSTTTTATIEVRSTLSTRWQLLPLAADPITQAHSVPHGMWVRRDVCLGYGEAIQHTSSHFSNRPMVLMQRSTNELLWPLRWPKHYADGDATPFKISHPLGGISFEQAMRSSALQSVGTAGQAALVVEATYDNLFHMLWHALPLREDVLALKPGLIGPLDLLPRYTVMWPDVNESVWNGWELVSRVLTASLRQPLQSSRREALLRPWQLHCYRAVYGGHSPFWPDFYKNASALINVRPRLAALRHALWLSIRSEQRHSARMSAAPRSLHVVAPGRSRPPTALFIVRNTSRTRVIANLDALRDQLATDLVLIDRIRFVALETMPLVEQFIFVSSASVLVGVHGQGMVWTAMLPTERASCAVLELFPKQMRVQRTHAWLDYRRWAYMNNVEYFALTQPDTRACVNQDFRACGNMEIVPSQVASAMRKVLNHVDTSRLDEDGARAAGPRLAEFNITDKTLRARARLKREVQARWLLRDAHVDRECITSARADGGTSMLCALTWLTKL